MVLSIHYSIENNMYFWQVLLLVVVACIAATALSRPYDDKLALRLRKLMIWVVPYVFITVGLCALLLQSGMVAMVFLFAAAACFFLFLKRDIG